MSDPFAQAGQGALGMAEVVGFVGLGWLNGVQDMRVRHAVEQYLGLAEKSRAALTESARPDTDLVTPEL
ncbi:MAG: hypothetical protein ABIZ09_07920 [Rhodoferax sp.]